MKILVAGLGYIGSSVAARLRAAGHLVVALTHSESSAAAAADAWSIPVAACDIASRDAVMEARRQLERGPGSTGTGDPFDAVLHCASSGRRGADGYREVYRDGCRHLAEAFPEARLVFTSSTSVYAQTDGEWVDEHSPAEPAGETGRLLLESEAIVLDSGGAVARLAGIYGPDRSVLLRRFLEGAASIDGDPAGDPLPVGRWLNQIHRDDAATALVRLLAGDVAAADGRPPLFNVADDEPMTQRHCYTVLAERFHRPLPPVHPPDLGRRRGWTNKRVSNRRLRSLGWRPAFPSYAAALAHDPALIPSILDQIESA